MLRDVVEVKPLPGHNLWIKFDDGVSGKADLKTLLGFKGVFAPLKDEQEFAKVYVHPELGVVCWPGGQDLDSEVLYALVTGKPITLGDGTIVSVQDDRVHA
jgi:hypothetical protein